MILMTSLLFTDVRIAALARGCGRITNVSLRACERLTDAGIVALSEGFPSTKHIYLEYIKTLRDAAIIALADNLEHIDLEGYCSGCFSTWVP